MGGGRWLVTALLLASRTHLVMAQETPEQWRQWWQPALVYLTSGYRAQWRYDQRTWTTQFTAQGTGILVHPDGVVLTAASALQATRQPPAQVQQGLLTDLARQRLELHNQAFPARKVPLTPANLQEAVTLIRPHARLEQREQVQDLWMAGSPAEHALRFQIQHQIQHIDPKASLALVTVPLTATPTLRLTATPPPPPGVPIYALTQPSPTVSPRAVLHKGTWTGQGPQFSQPALLNGALVFTAEGNVLGMLVRHNQQVRLVPTQVLQGFLQRAGVINTDSPVNRLWQQGLQAFWRGHYRRARSQFRQVLHLYPHHYPAQALLAEAEVAIRQGKDRSPWDGWFWVVLGGGLSALVAMGFVRRQRRARRIPPGQPVDPTQPLGTLEEMPTRLVMPPATSLSRSRCLVALAGPLQGATFPLTGDCYLGRDSQRCQIVIPDPHVSGQHAWIRLEGDRVFLRDCGSTNGTFLNSVHTPRITEVELRDQDVIILGQQGTVQFRFCVGQ
ncbi:MAG: FHA domain-containing protein [Gloeomargarita sp. SKYBB_i_bin120]|nr:FHA domain-containing protein [Gloeomargarita sp. SKYG98]MCS7291982.1 FHA domain-containing protein [Gloeomargarita sp. SKYB120]MDW8177542.1 FHA domain-containing protein [Gloeomargarita sp. SKYBB_i_bin120]